MTDVAGSGKKKKLIGCLNFLEKTDRVFQLFEKKLIGCLNFLKKHDIVLQLFENVS